LVILYYSSELRRTFRCNKIGRSSSTFSQVLLIFYRQWGFRTMPISVPG
jgi:hypothetical protein